MVLRASVALVLFALPLALPAPRAPQAQKDPNFVFVWMPVFGRRMDTLVYDFNGDGRNDVLNTSVDFDASPPTRWFALHLRDENGDLPVKPTFFWQVDDRAAALVFGNFTRQNGIDIAFLAADGVYVYPWENGRIQETPKKLLHVRTFFTTVPSNSIPIWELAEDLDGDGRHDLIVPTAEGYRVYFQTAPGRFGAVADLEAGLPSGAERVLAVQQFAERSEITASHFSATRQLPRVGVADIDGDGKQDLLTIRRDAITYFFQKEGRTFPSKRPARVTYRVNTLYEEAKKDTVNLSQIQFVNLKNDKMADLVVTKIEGTLGLTQSIKTRIYVHLNRTGRGNFVADKFIKIDGVSIDPSFVDMTHNGYRDVLTSRLRTDLLNQALSLGFLGDITITYEIFQFDPDTGNYLEEPVWSKDVRVTRKDLEDKGAASIALIKIEGDFDGDGRPDLVYIDPKTETLEIRRGRVHYQSGGKREVIGFEEDAWYSRHLDNHPKWVAILDSNGDGLADIFLMYAGSVGILESRRK